MDDIELLQPSSEGSFDTTPKDVHDSATMMHDIERSSRQQSEMLAMDCGERNMQIVVSIDNVDDIDCEQPSLP